MVWASIAPAQLEDNEPVWTRPGGINYDDRVIKVWRLIH